MARSAGYRAASSSACASVRGVNTSRLGLMFDILVFLFENYFHAGAYPDQQTLTKRLSAAGFDSRDISQALTWLSGLERVGHSNSRFSSSDGFRFYTEQELAGLTAEARGFLLFLETAGVIRALQRELIIERVLALDEPAVDLEKVKLIVLMVLWNQNESVDSLVLEELVSPNQERYLQ
jgi:Smg protein